MHCHQLNSTAYFSAEHKTDGKIPWGEGEMKMGKLSRGRKNV
jgi:hypothetical protein